MTRPKSKQKKTAQPTVKPPRAPKPPPVLAYDAKVAASLRRLAKLGVVKLKPSPDGTAVFVTREGQIALRQNPIRVSRADLRQLQSLAARDCAARRRVRVETAADVQHARDVARETRAAVREKTRADVDAARAKRDAERARQAGACDAARRDVSQAKGGRASRVSPKERAQERASMRTAEVAAEFGHIPGAMEFFRKTGGPVRWSGPRGVERFAQALHDEGRALTSHVADVPTDFADEYAAHEARERARVGKPPPKAKKLLRRLLSENDLALPVGKLDKAALSDLVSRRLVGVVDGYAVINEDRYSLAQELAA